ncbi:MAG TPA: SDR family oxidoreductase [Chitinophagaceae bacterium]|nr:SDR family oxidoreductase [Chitinophagaceae bacterium]
MTGQKLQLFAVGLSSMNLSLEGKFAIICGSTQGIGLAIAEELAVLGANCTLIARNEDALKAAVQILDIALRQQHGYIVADFSDPAKLKKAIEQHTKKNIVHILINNTGGPASGMIMDADESEFVNAFNQHLVCNHILTRAVVPSMKEEGYGRIINIISTSVKILHPNLGVSNTIRGAVASWAKTMANELGPFNITVNNILPGFTATARLQDVMESNAKRREMEKEQVEKEMINSIPLRRFGSSSEIAAVAGFLASPAGSYVSGTSIPVDGGRTGSI